MRLTLMVRDPGIFSVVFDFCEFRERVPKVHQIARQYRLDTFRNLAHHRQNDGLLDLGNKL